MLMLDVGELSDPSPLLPVLTISAAHIILPSMSISCVWSVPLVSSSMFLPSGA